MKADPVTNTVKMSPEERAKKEKVLSQPVKAIDLEKVSSLSDLLDGYAGMSIQARNLGACAKVFEAMLSDKDRPTIMLGMAGALIAGGLRKVIRDMVEHGLVDCIVSTGAILYQDIYQAKGFKHYVGTPDADDSVLRDLMIDRIYDTYVDEEKFWDTDLWVGKHADKLPPGKYSSRQFLDSLADELDDPNSIVLTAKKHGVPMFVPALNDSSIGIGLTEHYHRRTLEGREGVVIDSIQDNYELTQIVAKSKKTAAIYIAGGVPKNYINDSVVMAYIFGIQNKGHSYAFQLTMDSPHWGGLSGSTLKEATSWGKIHREATRSMAYVEPTVGLPLLVGSILQKGTYKDRSRIQLVWDRDILKEISFR